MGKFLHRVYQLLIFISAYINALYGGGGLGLSTPRRGGPIDPCGGGGWTRGGGDTSTPTAYS